MLCKHDCLFSPSTKWLLGHLDQQCPCFANRDESLPQWLLRLSTPVEGLQFRRDKVSKGSGPYIYHISDVSPTYICRVSPSKVYHHWIPFLGVTWCHYISFDQIEIGFEWSPLACWHIGQRPKLQKHDTPKKFVGSEHSGTCVSCLFVTGNITCWVEIKRSHKQHL